ncbi:MAG: hypothetical protein ACI93P_000012 [bacterium]|jgi:hypothetical protein
MSKDIKTPENNSEEVDLGQLFKMIGNMFDKFFRFFGNIFNKLFLAFIWGIFFVKKHIVILLIAGILGFGFGLLKENISDPVFKSSVLIRQNYITGETLYNTINYYNSLLTQKDFSTLAQELSIDSIYVSSILGFGVKPLISGNQRLVEFNKYTKGLDSALVSTIDYEDYIEGVKEYIYENQQLTINSTTNDNFNIVFKAIVNNLNSNTFFKREQEKDIRQLENRKLVIERALSDSDSLQRVYKNVLEKTLESQKGSQTSITIEGGDDTNKTKEFDLYKSDIELRRELVIIEREKENKLFIIEILSNTPNRGFTDTSIEFLGRSFSPKVFYAAFFISVLFSILFLSRFIKFLEKYKNQV